MNYFISDLHLGHVNCLGFDNRPFINIEEHDQTIIKNWNNVVGIDDDIYILGDISWYNTTKTIEIIKQLNGNKHWIIGNHDGKLLKNKELRDLFVEIRDYKEIILDNGKGIVLSHYPIVCFKNHFYNWYHLYGHVHISFEENMVQNFKLQMTDLYNKPLNMWNVGCMMPYMNYSPRTLEEIVGLYKTE